MPLPSTQATALAESNIGGLMLSTQSQSARPRTGSNVRGSLYVTASSPLKSNLPSLNIQNLYLLMEEVKVCTITNHQHFYEQSNPQPNSSRVRVEGLWKNGGVSGSKGNAGNNGEIVYAQPSDLLSTIAAAITPVIDKNEFNRQLDVTKVKEGKEPFKWDWITISQLLEHSFTQPDRLQEALRSKWLRRISGFFRCSPEEKGYFANMDWEPNNLQYLEIACNLYSVLMKEDVGFQFLTQDRRGMIFNEIAYELELLTNYASNRSNQVFNLNPFSGNNGTNGSGGNSSTGISSSKMVFRMHSCSYSMAREFFSLLGRILRNNKSRRLLDHTNVFQHLTVLGQYHSLDYVSRLVITSLSFTDGGIISRHLYQFWTADEINGSCSKLLREYLFNLLRVLIRCQHHHKHFQDQELYMWCVETILSQLAIDDDTSHNINVNESLCILYKGMMECLHSRTCAQLVISKRPRFILNHYQQLIARQPGNVGTVPLTASTSSSSNDDASAIHNKEMLLHGILIRLLGFSEGIQFLSEKSYVDTLIQTWCQQRNKAYVTLVEERMNNAMLQAHHLKAHHAPLNGASVDMLSLIQPIPMKIPDVPITYNKFSPPTFTTSDFDTTGFDPYQQLDFDFHGLFRVPWNIEAKIVNHGLMTSDIVSNTGEYIRVDAFLDISEVHSPLAYEVTYDRNRYLKVRGIVLDSKGFPGGKAVNPNASVFSTLLAGISPIFKNGTVQTLGESGSIRKRTSTNTRDVSNSVTTSSRSSFVGSSTPGANNEVFQDNDLPVTLGQEQSYEWITCRAGHRQGSNLFELEDGRFAVAIPNEPVAFIFSRKAPLTSTSSVGQRNKSMSGAGSRSNSISDPWFDANRTNRMDSSRSGGMLYLVEIHYFISVETGQAMFVPMPRHLFGELGRTVDGCAELTKRNLIFEMVGKAHNLFDQLQKPSSISSSSLTGAGVSTPLSLSTTSPHANATSSLQTILSQHANNTLELRAILWSLGHLASNDLGLGLLLGVDPSFIEWCVESVANCNYFSLRGTFFHIIGLISRSLAGGKKLNRLGWHSADYGNPSAVAVPRSTSGMFGRSNSVSNDPLHNSTSSSGLGMKKAALALSRLNVPHAPVMPFMNNLTIPQAVKNLVPFSPLGTLSVEQEVLNIILKMPGVILYRECKSKLDHIRRENSDVFSKRSLFVDVMRIMEVYNFKLSVRREILALFSETAKQRPVTPVSSISCGESFSERQ